MVTSTYFNVFFSTFLPNFCIPNEDTTLLPGNNNSLELVWFLLGMRNDGAAKPLQSLSKQNNSCSSALELHLFPKAANPETAEGIQR